MGAGEELLDPYGIRGVSTTGRHANERGNGTVYLPMIDFGIQFARFTLLPQLGASVRNAAALYEAMFERQPDAFQSSSPGPFPGSLAHGIVGDIQLVIQQQPARLDITFQPQPQVQQGDDLVKFGAAVDVRSHLTSLASALPRALSGAPLTRVASYLQLGRAASSHAEAIRVLLGTMPQRYRMSLADEEDLIFQVNRPKPSAHGAERRINCITKWSVDRLTTMMVTNTAAPVVRHMLVSCIGLDNSTAPDSVVLPDLLVYPLLKETYEAFDGQLRDLGLRLGGFDYAD